MLLSYSFIDKKGKNVNSLNPHTAMIPASNMKIVTGFIAYSILGSDYKITTEFGLDDKALIISGGPTPLLRFSTIDDELKKLRELDIDKIHLNGSLDEDFYGPGWLLSDENECYQSRITSFSINENCVPKAGNLDGESVNDPHSSEGIPDKTPYETFSRRILGRTKSEILPSVSFTESRKGRVIAKHSEKVGEILNHMETVSCNFSAESLFKFMHHYKTGLAGSWKGGASAVMREISLNKDDIIIVDGSGLSRINRLNTLFLSRLINIASKYDNGKFLSYLPGLGKGTLKNRLSGFSEYGILAKTGTLSGVSSLSGFIGRSGISFSIIVNDSEKQDDENQNIIDEILSSNIQKYERNVKQ